MMPPRRVQARREREFQNARTKAEVDALQERWADEDEALAKAQPRPEPAPDLHRRIAGLEQRIDDLTKALAARPTIAQIADAVGLALAQQRKEIESSTLSYAGTWREDKAYPISTLVTHGGGGWVSTAATEPGDRPGRCGFWRLAVKGGKP